DRPRLLPAGERGVEVDEGVHAMHGRPVIAELELRDARGRGVKRPDPVEAETERFQDQNAYGDAVSDHAHHLIAVTGPEPLETAQHALAHLPERLGARR